MIVTQSMLSDDCCITVMTVMTYISKFRFLYENVIKLERKNFFHIFKIFTK